MNRRALIVADSLLPAGTHAALAKGALDAGFEEFIRDFDATAAPRLRMGFKAGMFAAIWVAPILIRRIPPVTLYDRATRERALEALAGSRLYSLRQAFGVLKLTLALCYGADDDVRAAIGYGAPHVDPYRAARLP